MRLICSEFASAMCRQIKLTGCAQGAKIIAREAAMSTQALSTGKEKITVNLPQELAEQLCQHVPARKRDAFIVHALQEQLALEEQLKVLEETAGAWKDADHPELATGADIAHLSAIFFKVWTKGRRIWGIPFF